MTSLNCPIRGSLKITKRAKDGITFTEEYQRIECVKFLLSKNYPKEHFDFEKDVLAYGNRGINTLRADIILYNRNKELIKKDERVKCIYTVVEVKRKNDKTAINMQLLPALNHCPNAEFGIYWDDKQRIFIKKDEQEKEYDVIRFPRYGETFDEKLLKFDDLQPIDDHTKLLNIIEQKLHNTSGQSKTYRYDEIFKLLLVKYYDEIENSNKNLVFQIYKNETDGDFEKRINDLYKKAKTYYTQNSKLKVDDEIRLKIDNMKWFVDKLQNYSFLKTNQSVIQDFFIKFAPQFLRAELDQYYTPQEIVVFVSNIIKIEPTSLVLDPCGGSADFLTSFIKKGENEGIKQVRDNIHYWDISEDASSVATLNMILNGDGRTNVDVRDSIKDSHYKNESFDVIATNPPFGKDTKWER